MEIIFMIMMLISFIAVIILSRNSKSLNKIKSEEVGNGQHGTDRFMSIKEAKEKYNVVKLSSDTWEDKSDEWEPGRILYFDQYTKELVIDTSTTHATVQAPTNTGKTTEVNIPNIQYNLCAGVNMIIPCIKKEVLNLTYQQAQELGYNCYVIDFADPACSLGIDLFDDINKNLELYKKTKDLRYKSAAETEAGKLATDIVTSRPRSDSENKFFVDASKGVIHAVILLVCMFAKNSEKHFSSVRKMIQDLISNQASDNKKKKEPKIQKLLNGMPDDFSPKKHIGSAFAAGNETEENIYASTLGDLNPMNDAMAEQIISVPGKKDMFNYKKLINEKCVLYIYCPESKKEFFLFFKLIIKKITNQLCNYANEYCNGKLPKQVRIEWDEFALSPKIDDVDEWMSIIRAYGIFLTLYYQDPAQLKKVYGEDIMKITEHNAAVNYVLGVAAKDTEEAERLSKALGTKTIKSGSISYSHEMGKTSNSTTEQMIERPLMTPGEILRMSQNKERLIFLYGNHPLKVQLTPYYDDHWPMHPKAIVNDYQANRMHQYYEIDYLDFENLEKQLDDYRLMNGIMPKKSTVTIELMNKNQPQPSRMIKTVIEDLNKLIGHEDERIKDLVEGKQWLDLYQILKRDYDIPTWKTRKIIGKMKEE